MVQHIEKKACGRGKKGHVLWRDELNKAVKKKLKSCMTMLQGNVPDMKESMYTRS